MKLSNFTKSVSIVATIFSLSVTANVYAGYKLPYKSGSSYPVTKGAANHSGKEKGAVDFSMPKGTPILASQAGTVTKIQMSYKKGACDPKLANYANYVVVKHDDGYSTLYLHLLENSATVKVGQRVTQGQTIAKSSNTGYSCGATGNHLHFQKQQSCTSWYCQAVPAVFDEVGRELKTGDKPVSRNPR
jgi:murein DD-endopeptidase MepM/ murein hydrolase activator NlpD